MALAMALGTTATNTQVVNELHGRNYYSVAEQTTTLPSATWSQIVAWSVDGALQSYGYAKVTPSSSRVYIPTTTWNNIINAAISISTQLSSQYTVTGAVNGLGGLRGLGSLRDATGMSWWDTYMPTILQMIGSGLTIWGTTWATNVTRRQISQQVQSATGAALPTGTQAQANAMAQQLMAQGMSATEAQARANNIVLGTQLPCQYTGTCGTSQLPSWALPVGIAIGAYALLSRKRG